MSQSDEHRKLVTQVAEVVTHQFPHLQIIIDIQSHPGDPVPPMICGYRPDLYAANRDFIAIAEAKTTKDLKSQHTYNQVASFLSYLEQKKMVTSSYRSQIAGLIGPKLYCDLYVSKYM